METIHLKYKSEYRETSKELLQILPKKSTSSLISVDDVIKLIKN